MSIPLNTIYSYFETGDFPTQEQFKASWSSFWHKDESVPTTKIAGLDSLLQNKVDKNMYELHLADANAHTSILAKRDASNLNSENVQSWKTMLEVGNLPSNTATVDDFDELGNISEFGNVYTKNQSHNTFISFGDYTDNNGNILAEKIEALGLTTLIEAVETTISDFANHSDAYDFEDNDFIAIPVNNENYSLYLFKGGVKNDKSNYLSTGLSNITIGMVEGLQSELNKIKIVQDGLTNLNTNLQSKADKTTLDNHALSLDSHVNYLAKIDAANLNAQHIQSWKNALGVKELQSNLATFDDGINTGNVYTKDQSDSKYIFSRDFLNGDHKILAEKIEALGLTTLIESSEKSISEFADRSEAYQFEDNDFIAIPDERGHFSLYIFKGGEKKEAGNYLPTGLSNITIGMVEGLQGELNKMQVLQEELSTLNTSLQYKTDKITFDSHVLSPDSHADYLSKRDASNLNNENIQSWKRALGIKELLSNIATFDDGLNTGNVYTKDQSDSKYMFLRDFLNDDNKILAEKIEALGLTTLIEASEKSISEFVKHSDLYKFENNDFIAVPDERGNFSLYLFKGGNKADTSNYLSTGLSNITMGMVEGLSGELNKIQVVQDGLINLNTSLQYKADKATVLEQFSTFTTDLQSKADKATLQQEVNRIKVVEDGLADVNTNLEIKADKATVFEQFSTFTTDLQSKADKVTLQQEVNRIKVVEDGLADVNVNLEIKADKATVSEQLSMFTTDLQSKADKVTLQQEVNRIKVVEDGLAAVNTNLEIKADKATVSEQLSTFTTDLQSKADKVTLQQEVNRIKVVEDGLVNVNATLQYKADKATIQEQLGGVNANLQNKADKEALENHLWSADSHISYLTKRDASNLDSKNIYDWQRALGILELTQPKTNYKIYRALLHVDEKSFEPRFTVLENTIGDIDWKRNDVGLYTGSLDKAFPEGRVWINSKINIPFSKSSPVDCMAVRFDDNIVNLTILARNQDYTPVDMEGEFGIIEIYVYDK